MVSILCSCKFFFLCVCVCVCVFLIVAGLSLRCCARAFSSCRARRLLSGRGAQAARRGGFPCCGARALGRAGSILQLWHTGFVAPRQVGSSQIQDRTLAPAAPALPGRFLTKGLPGKSLFSLLWLEIRLINGEQMLKVIQDFVFFSLFNPSHM